VVGVVFFMAPTSVVLSRPIAIRCMDNSACADLDGDCCPTPAGFSLRCCKASNNIVKPTLTTRAACDSNTACKGLFGSCCPNTDGIQLECCTNKNNTLIPPHPVSALCSKSPGCRNIGLTNGNCCPADNGNDLSCCPPTSSRGGSSD